MGHDAKKLNTFAVVVGMCIGSLLTSMALTTMAVFRHVTDLAGPSFFALSIVPAFKCLPTAVLIGIATGTLVAAVAPVILLRWKPRKGGVWLVVLVVFLSLGPVSYLFAQTMNQVRMGGPYKILKQFRAPDRETVVLITYDAPGWVDGLAFLRIKERRRWGITRLVGAAEASERSHARDASVDWAADSRSFTFVWPGHLEGYFAHGPDEIWRKQQKTE